MGYFEVKGKVRYNNMYWGMITADIFQKIQARSVEHAIEAIESSLSVHSIRGHNVFRWVVVPVVTEIPEDEYMRLMNAPVLFSLDPV